MVWPCTKYNITAWSSTKCDTMFWGQLPFLMLSFRYSAKCSNILAQHHSNNIAITKSTAIPAPNVISLCMTTLVVPNVIIMIGLVVPNVIIMIGLILVTVPNAVLCLCLCLSLSLSLSLSVHH